MARGIAGSAARRRFRFCGVFETVGVCSLRSFGGGCERLRVCMASVAACAATRVGVLPRALKFTVVLAGAGDGLRLRFATFAAGAGAGDGKRSMRLLPPRPFAGCFVVSVPAGADDGAVGAAAVTAAVMAAVAVGVVRVAGLPAAGAGAGVAVGICVREEATECVANALCFPDAGDGERDRDDDRDSDRARAAAARPRCCAA